MESTSYLSKWAFESSKDVVKYRRMVLNCRDYEGKLLYDRWSAGAESAIMRWATLLEDTLRLRAIQKQVTQVSDMRGQ